MANTEAHMKVSVFDLTNQMTVHVRVRRLNEWRVRVRLGLFFVRLGVLITGCRCEVEPWK